MAMATRFVDAAPATSMNLFPCMTADAFGMRLRHDVDLDALSGELIDVVYETLQPAHVSLWLRQKRGRVVLLSTSAKE